MFIFGHLAVIEFQMCCCVPYFIKTGRFPLRYDVLRTCNMADVGHFEFSKCRLYGTSPLSPCYSASLCKISLKSGNRLLSYGQNRLLKWRPSAILNFKNVRIRLRDCHGVENLHLCTKLHQNRMRYGDFTIFKTADLRHLAF